MPKRYYRLPSRLLGMGRTFGLIVDDSKSSIMWVNKDGTRVRSRCPMSAFGNAELKRAGYLPCTGKDMPRQSRTKAVA